MSTATRDTVDLEREDDSVDPELLELPDPPKRDRTVAVGMLVVTALASLAMVAALASDARYALSTPEAKELGDLSTAPPAAFAENAFVRGHGLLGAAGAIRYERPLMPGSFRLMPVAGHPNVWVEVRVPSGGENMRYVPPTTFSGRLMRLDGGGPKHRGLASALRGTTRETVPEGAWLLVDGEAPANARWAVLLIGMFLGFAAWSAWAAAKLLRRVPTKD
ncbi:MAG: hypothetical protein KC657_26905 [Myxococcales bacterium]|nr:hypothetical protein [Myxococcales bacterium]